MEDIKLRDLSRIPDSRLTHEERVELKRRYDEFVGRLRKEGNLPPPEAKPKAKRIQPWDPRTIARRH